MVHKVVSLILFTAARRRSVQHPCYLLSLTFTFLPQEVILLSRAHTRGILCFFMQGLYIDTVTHSSGTRKKENPLTYSQTSSNKTLQCHITRSTTMLKCSWNIISLIPIVCFQMLNLYVCVSTLTHHTRREPVRCT